MNANAPARRSAVGRADLLLLLDTWRDDPAGLAVAAELAGLERRPPPPPPAPPPDERTHQPAGGTAPPPGAPPPPVSPVAVGGLTFYRVTGRTPIPRPLAPGERPDWARTTGPVPPAPPAPSPAPEPAPEPEPLTPWRRLWPHLRAVLGQPQEDRAPDLPRVVETLARAQVPRRWPRRRRHHWAPACRVILDWSPHLAPFREDLRRLIEPLTRLRGALGLCILCAPEGPAGPFIEVAGRHARLHWTLPPAAPDLPLLAVTDLGAWADPARRAAWAALGERLRRAGVRPAALVPVPPRYWDPAHRGLWTPATWDRRHRLPTRPGGPRPWPGAPADPVTDPGARHLLDLLAPALRLEPALLRALRHRLDGPGLDVGTEAAAWFHPDLEPCHGAAEWRHGAVREARHAAHRAHPEADRRLAADLLRAHHRHLAPSIQAEESLHLGLLFGAEDPAQVDYRAQGYRTLESPPDPHLERRLRQYLGRAGERQPAAAWQDERLAAAWVLAHRERLRDPNCPLPEGLRLSRVDWVLAGGSPPVPWTLLQRGAGLILARAPALVDPLDPGPAPLDPLPASPLAQLPLTDTPLQYAPRDAPGHQHSTPPGAPDPIPLPPAGLVLRGWDAELSIEPLTRPDWAGAIGCDGAGLWVEVGVDVGVGVDVEVGVDVGDEAGEGGSARRLRWVPPGALPDPDAADPAAVPHGAFWDQSVYVDWRRGTLLRPGWALRTGLDQYGHWAEFEVRGVVVRMRWIWPGEFVMGSPAEGPERELGREDDEVQHQVLLTRGLWLADTACTQALWSAVMGENPSKFQGPERPVEQVNWDEVQTFTERLGVAVPGLAPRLPTESEWEYACRAGTLTPFSFGATIGTDQVNYDGRNPYGGGAKGLHRQTTVEVKALPANDWGLYQMHGNVWEWCADWYGVYPGGTAIDPQGAATGVRRVLRGGSWISRAGNCRSAQRDVWGPAYPWRLRGFRLARGPQASPAGPGTGTSGGAPGAAQGRTDAPGGVGPALRGVWRRLRGR